MDLDGEGKVRFQGETVETLSEITYMQKAPGRGWLELAVRPVVTFWLLQIEYAPRSPQVSVTVLVMSCATNYPET